MAQQTNADDVINHAAEIFCQYYDCDYPKCSQVKEGLKRLLHDRYRDNAASFVEHFVHPTQSLLSHLQEEQFPLCSNGKVVVHLVPPVPKLALGEFFYQVGHTNPHTLVVKFAKYRKTGTSLTVNELKRSTVDEADYDIAFTKEYFDQVRSEAPQGLGDVLMRTLIVLSNPVCSVRREGAVELHLKTCPTERHGRLRSDSHLSVQVSCDDESSMLSDWSTGPHSAPTENNDFSSLRDDVFRRMNSASEPVKY